MDIKRLSLFLLTALSLMLIGCGNDDGTDDSYVDIVMHVSENTVWNQVRGIDEPKEYMLVKERSASSWQELAIGSIEGFVEAMNQRAQEMGLSDTHYVTACGLDAPDHYSSAFDLAKLTRNALQNTDFSYICAQSEMQVRFGNPPYDRWLSNYNRLLELYPDCIGVKTGFTDDAGRCLVSAAERDGMTLICVTLDAIDDWNLHASLYDECFANYSMQTLPSTPTSITLIDDEGVEEELTLQPAWKVSVPLKAGESARLDYTILSEPFTYAPVAADRIYAQALYLLDDRPFCIVPLIAASSA